MLHLLLVCTLVNKKNVEAKADSGIVSNGGIREVGEGVRGIVQTRK